MFLGNVARGNKGVDTAIEIARRTGIRLVIAGGRRLACIETWLPIRRNIKSVGVVYGQAKIELIRRAKALIFPIRWEEPFGLVLIEAMACGTPVLAADRGAVREIDSVACRRHVENNFTIQHTYAGCLTCYRRAIAGEVW